jgi:hypothetical protein
LLETKKSASALFFYRLALEHDARVPWGRVMSLTCDL